MRFSPSHAVLVSSSRATSPPQIVCVYLEPFKNYKASKLKMFKNMQKCNIIIFIFPYGRQRRGERRRRENGGAVRAPICSLRMTVITASNTLK